MFVLKVTRVVSQSCSLQSGPGTGPECLCLHRWLSRFGPGRAEEARNRNTPTSAVLLTLHQLKSLHIASFMRAVNRGKIHADICQLNLPNDYFSSEIDWNFIIFIS